MDRREGLEIHPSALVEAGARLAPGVRIGPYAYIEADVEIGVGTTIGPYAALMGPLRLGRGNRIHAHACLGDAPQDTSHAGEPTRLEIGDDNTFREFVTVHRGTTKGGGVTRIGNANLLMAYSHVGHDCQLGNHIIIANAVNLGGHVSVGDYANLGGMAAVHQFVRIGRHAMIGGGSILVQDVPPFMMAAGNHARLHGLNRRGLLRAGLPLQTRNAIKRAHRILYRSGLRLNDACAQLRELAAEFPEVAHLLDFMQHSQRGIAR